MANNFVHLHNHSDYSLLDGSATVAGLAGLAKSYNMPAVALTDHGNMLGILSFEDACKKKGIKAIIGCEVYVAYSRHDRKAVAGERSNFHMVLLATNEVGYKNLLTLTSKAYTEGFYYKPRVDDELLQQHYEGLIALSGCLVGEVSYLIVNNKYEEAKKRALYYDKLFGRNNFYLEIQDHGFPEDKIIRKELPRLSAETGIPLVATNDVHYLLKEDETINDILICVGTQAKRDDVERMRASPNCYLKTADEMAALFADLPEALANTVKIAERCNLTIPKPGALLPDYVIPAGYANEEAYLTYLVNEGLNSRYNPVTPAIKERAAFEIATISKMGFVGYFLIVWDFIKWAKDNGISVGPGRGSGAGSIVAYSLAITDIDPLKYNLLFERFLNPERISMPDFDIDFNDERRDEVAQYISKKYGDENVAGIVTYSTLQTKAALKDVARVLDIHYGDSLAITKAVTKEHKNVKDALENSSELKEFAERGGVYAELFDIASRVEGQVRGTGVHACGHVIGKTQVVDYAPLITADKDGEKIIVTAYEGTALEDCGLVKMDLLGLSTLGIIDRTIAMVKETEPNFEIKQIPEDDKKVFKLFGKADTAGIFQFESDGMRKVLKETDPESIEDLIALNSLYRPGPMDYIPDFIKGKRNPKSVIYDDPSLAEILKPTYGVIVYQEQVMQVAQIYAGYSLGGADILRRAMGKKKPEEMAKQKAVFVEGAKANGHSETGAVKIFEKLEKFAGYGFNKSHAACYSVLAYQTAYLKVHYPAQFMAAVLSKNINNPSSFKKYLDEAKAMGLQIFPPDINQSAAGFSASSGQIYYGLQGLKGVGEQAVNEVITARQDGLFKNFNDFLDKMPLQSVNKRVVEIFIKAGLFDGLKEFQRGKLLANYEAAIDHAVKKKASQNAGPSLFDAFADEVAFPEFTFTEAEDIVLDQKLEHEKELLGFYISGHPLDKFKGAWQQHHTLNLANTEEALLRKEYCAVGLIKNIKSRITKSNTKMSSFILEDYNGSIEVVVFSKVLADMEPHLIENATLMLYGKVDKNGSEPQFRLDRVALPDAAIKAKATKNEERAKELHLYLKEDNEINKEELLTLRDIIGDSYGESLIYLHFNNKIIKGGRLLRVAINEEIIQKLKANNLVKEVQAI
ncbi:MAG: DNA polymerase III subunit alpha [Spirochaetaceae bacterium]|nr:DNA polymerase III subunit alpha [Spirochaetaceae bacterium]